MQTPDRSNLQEASILRGNGTISACHDAGVRYHLPRDGLHKAIKAPIQLGAEENEADNLIVDSH